MSNTNTGGPAFPIDANETADRCIYTGMTLRQYAAIKLRVPDSGTDWLDEMIRKSQKDCFAAKAMQVLLAEVDGPNDDVPGAPRWLPEDASSLAYQIADAMLRAREAS